MNQRQSIVRRVLNEQAGEPFAWGQLDCVQFSISAADEIAGKKHSAEFEYEDESSAQKLRDAYGGLVGLFSSVFGAPLPVEYLDDGDPCLVEIPGIGELMGMWVNARAIVKSEGGTIDVPSSRVLKGWHVCLKQ